MDARRFIRAVARRIDHRCGSRLEIEVQRMPFTDIDIGREDVYFALFRAMAEMIPLQELHAQLLPSSRYSAWDCGNLMYKNCKSSYRGYGGAMDAKERDRRFHLYIRRFLFYFALCLLNGLPELYRRATPLLDDRFLISDLELALRTTVERMRSERRAEQFTRSPSLTVVSEVVSN